MKKELPLFLGLLVGFFALIEFYIPHHYVGTVKDYLINWTLVMAAGAYVIGGINILQVNVPKVRRRTPDWQYKVVLLTGAAVMALVGVKWHTFGGAPSTALQVDAAKLKFDATDFADQKQPDRGVVVVYTDEPDALVQVGPSAVTKVQPRDGRYLAVISVPPGKHTAKVYMKAAGYTELTADVEVKDGGVAVAAGSPTMMWGPSGRVFVWLYDHVFAPCNATMFALLAFFVASAAFRAFRARNAEAALLLFSAIIILIGRAPMGRAIHPLLPEVADWILDIPNNAGRRAIMMGAAIGAIATGLRVILGLERSHLGSD